tara:strand:+ start:938 stop:1498 length:561 start_codon:yes stop_codon:yes gene_type:complete
MSYKNTIIGILMTLAISAAVVMTLTNRNAPNRYQDNSVLPDAYMENVTATILDKFGKVSMKIVTPKMVHYTKNDTTDFTQPELTLYHKSPNPWFIASKTAKSNHGIDQVIFHDDVTIHHPADFKNPATVIKTSVLTVHPNERTAETTESITMVQPNSIMKAIGMFADMDSGNIKLLSHAKGEYVPD